jgi:hypothetical protein
MILSKDTAIYKILHTLEVNSSSEVVLLQE